VGGDAARPDGVGGYYGTGIGAKRAGEKLATPRPGLGMVAEAQDPSGHPGRAGCGSALLEHAYGRLGEDVGRVAERPADRYSQDALIRGQRPLPQQVPQGLIVALGARL
jgi:hypothetical protein